MITYTPLATLRNSAPMSESKTEKVVEADRIELDYEWWFHRIEAETIWKETSDPYHEFISDLGIEDGGRGKVDSLYANSFEFGFLLWRWIYRAKVRENVVNSWEDYNPGDRPITYDLALEIMRRAEEEEIIKVTDSRRHVYRPDTEVFDT